MILYGIPVSSGVAIAPALVYRSQSYQAAEAHLTSEQIAGAKQALEAAFAMADSELAALMASFSQSEAEQAKIFQAHREILQDEDLKDAILTHIESDHMAAESAVDAAANEFIALIGKVDDANIALRAADIEDVRRRLIRCLRKEAPLDLACLQTDCILVARDLLPSDTARLDRAHVLGIVTEVGGVTSHTAILARSYGIPALLGADGVLNAVRNGSMLCLDAPEGSLNVEPDEEKMAVGLKKRDAWLEKRRSAEMFRGKPGKTKDGVSVQIGVNIGSADDDISEDADFVGLFRTEFLYMGSDHLPTEEEQFQAYRRVLEKAHGKPVTLRTLDIGGDKSLPYMKLPKEDNPFLGEHALRFCLARTDVFKTQLRAALRASV